MDRPLGRALGGAGVVCLVLAALPGFGGFLAVVAGPVLYLLGVPVGWAVLRRVDDRAARLAGLAAVGLAGGLVVGVVPTLVRLVGPAVIDVRGAITFTASCGAIGAAIALVAGTAAELLPAPARPVLAVLGPVVLAAVTALYITITW